MKGKLAFAVCRLSYNVMLNLVTDIHPDIFLLHELSESSTNTYPLFLFKKCKLCQRRPKFLAANILSTFIHLVHTLTNRG